MADWIPIASQIKSFVQFVCNDSEGARQTQINFSKRCPVVAQVRSAVEVIVDGREAAEKTQLEFLDNFGKTANSVPIIGHVKGGVHYICGDTKGGNDAMKAATRTVGAIAGGAVGLAAGGPPGAIAVGAAGATVVDGIFTGIQSAYHREFRPSGVLQGVSDIVDDPKNAGLWVDTAFIVATDGTTGLLEAQKELPELKE